ncbi:hypothetical protein LCGC14_2470100, partial [marine sediment metagenome]
VYVVASSLVVVAILFYPFMYVLGVVLGFAFNLGA